MSLEEDREAPKPAHSNIGIEAGHDEATTTPPNSSIEPLDPAFDQPTDTVPGFVGQTGGEGPIVEDLTPSYGESGAIISSVAQPIGGSAESSVKGVQHVGTPAANTPESASKRSRGEGWLIRKARKERKAAEERERNEAVGLNIRKLSQCLLFTSDMLSWIADNQHGDSSRTSLTIF